MAPKSLFTQINKSILDCTIVGHRFLPCDVVDSIITRENLKDEISSGWKSRLSRDDMPSKISRNGKKLFAILLIIGEKHKIKDLLKEGITDNDLPFSGSTEPNSGGIRTSDPNKEVHSFRQWEEAKTNLFLRSQWIVLAPVLETDGATITVDPLCPLPFIKGDTVHGPHHSIVYKSVLHSAHQTHHLPGRTTNLVVAVKQLENAIHFIKERKNLEDIRSLNHPHIIQHLNCFDCEKSFFISFPWAEGGNLRDFWKHNDANRDLMMWSLQQMLGITSALSSLHRINFRHGDLKPANILHFKRGGYGTLAVADVGVSRTHAQATQLRHGPTLTQATTPSYEPPEVYVEKDHPRGRRYDIWSMACILLEHIVWMLYGFDAINSFAGARDEPDVKFFRLHKEKESSSATIHPAVEEAIRILREDERCEEGTAFADLIDLITEHLLRVTVEERVTAQVLNQMLQKIVQRAAQNPSYLLRHPARTPDIHAFFTAKSTVTTRLTTST
ncbi:unnamed protein product [Colletotrichum noveboracense]|uniref:Protein kinase domain-containing protein n=1 Tax=Colletotrichum noveboracense TaxID=2664923 RepID=A0A9W4RIZ4_9PEZI|nr:unnamed protein product [Colletotrichum noveboracense]